MSDQLKGFAAAGIFTVLYHFAPLLAFFAVSYWVSRMFIDIARGGL